MALHETWHWHKCQRYHILMRLINNMRKRKLGSKEQGANATENRWLVIPRTLCFVTHGNDILLMKRAANKRVFPNKYNGLGGHIERDEDAKTSAIREIKEESGLEVINVQLRGVTNIDANPNYATGILLLVFTAEATNRDFTDCSEGKLEWVALDKVYEKDLVEDLPILLPRLFGEKASNSSFIAHVSYDSEDNIIFRFADEI